MSAVPRPFPIVTFKPQNGMTAAVILRVLEAGHGDVYVQYILSVRDGWLDKLSHVLDRMVRDARLEVGVRHGTWICHVVQMDYPYPGAGLYLPPVAPELRRRNPREVRWLEDPNRWDVTPETFPEEYRSHAYR